MITAIILAAGMSKRMGKSKMTLPWGASTVIEKVVRTIEEACVGDIYIVCGENLPELKQSLHQHKVTFLYNKDYAQGEMLSSVKTALKYLEQQDSDATLIVLGDQPQIEVHVVRAIMDEYLRTRSKIIIPSYQYHRGHPWLVERSFWKDIIDLDPDRTLRDFLSTNQEVIAYIDVTSSSVIEDIDTPQDYERYQPRLK